MKRHYGVASFEIHQFSIGFGHLRLNHLNVFIPKRKVLNVQRFKIRGGFVFSFVFHFAKQIHHLVSHFTALHHIGINQQGTRRRPHDGLKHRFEVEEAPGVVRIQIHQSCWNSFEGFCHFFKPSVPGSSIPLLGSTHNRIADILNNQIVSQLGGRLIVLVGKPAHGYTQFDIDTQPHIIQISIGSILLLFESEFVVTHMFNPFILRQRGL